MTYANMKQTYVYINKLTTQILAQIRTFIARKSYTTRNRAEFISLGSLAAARNNFLGHEPSRT